MAGFEDRFWAKVDVRDFGGCWWWTGWVCNGYGRFGPRKEYAHRVVWELLVGPIPAGLVIDHDHPVRGCGNTLCVNPGHLAVVSRSVNNHRGRGTRRNNTSGIPNVFYVKTKDRWQAQVRGGGKLYYGPCRRTKEEAAGDVPGVEARAVPDEECSVAGCHRFARRRGWCVMHYSRVIRFGGPGPAGPMGKADSLENRFADAVQVRGACHVWVGSVTKQGYGSIGFKGRKLLAHRVAWFLAYGGWPVGRVGRRCSQRLCVRADHLYCFALDEPGYHSAPAG